MITKIYGDLNKTYNRQTKKIMQYEQKLKDFISEELEKFKEKANVKEKDIEERISKLEERADSTS